MPVGGNRFRSCWRHDGGEDVMIHLEAVYGMHSDSLDGLFRAFEVLSFILM